MNDQQAFDVNSHVRISKKFTLGYAAMQIYLTTAFDIVAICKRAHIDNGDLKIDLPFETWYPFDAKRPGIFEICFLVQLWITYICIFALVAPDVLLFDFVRLITMHSARLNRSISNVNDLDEKESIKKCIESHMNIIKWVVKLS